MFRGLFLYLYSRKDFESLREIKNYCDAHEVLLGTSCEMGEASDEEAYWGRVVMTPGMRYQLNRMLDSSLKLTPETTLNLKEGFEAHLDVIRIYTDYLIDGGLSDSDVDIFKAYAEFSPRNSLFQILANKFSGGGDQSKAIETLLDEKLFPSGRLPTDGDRYTDYLWSRNNDDDWQPCNESNPCTGHIHSGIDMMFAVKLLEE